MRNARLQVLYIAGWSRSGATILGQLLGQIEGACCIGEMQYIWERGAGQNRLCACGEPFDACPYWRLVLQRAFGGIGNVDTQRLRALHATMLRSRNVMFGAKKLGRFLRSADGRYYLDVTERLYRAIRDMSGSRVMVDTSHNPSYALLLNAIPNFDVHILHLVRDPRPSAYSHWRTKPSPDKGPGQFLKRVHPAESTVKWVIWNQLISTYAKRGCKSYSLVRYEEMVNDLEHTLRPIVSERFCSQSAEAVLSGKVVDFGGVHMVAGNPVRFRAGAIAIKEDVEWKASMSPTHKWLVSAISAPWMRRFGYSVL